MTSQNGFDGLRKLYDSEYEYVQAFFDYIADRTKNSKETTVDRAVRTLRVQGYECTRNDLIWLFKELDHVGVGDFIVGRRGQKSRFRWGAEMTKVGKFAQGEDLEIVILDEAVSLEEEDHEDVPAGFIRHTYNLRPDLTIRVSLPTDISPTEAQRFSDYVRTLSYGDP